MREEEGMRGGMRGGAGGKRRGVGGVMDAGRGGDEGGGKRRGEEGEGRRMGGRCSDSPLPG